MSTLSRKTRPLLRTVAGKRHATEDDHIDGLRPRAKSPRLDPQQEEDIYGSPESSSGPDEAHDAHSTIPSSADYATASSATSLSGGKIPKSAIPQRRATSHRRMKGASTTMEPSAQSATSTPASEDAGDSDGSDLFGQMGGARGKQVRAAGYANRNKTTTGTFRNPPIVPERPNKPAARGYKQPKQIDDATPSLKATTTFRIPQGTLEPATTAVREAKFKAPIPIADLKNGTKYSTKSTRRSSRVANLTDPATEPAKFRMIPYLNDPITQNADEVAKVLHESPIGFGDELDAAVHSSQLDPDHIGFEDDADFEDIQALSGDEDDSVTCPYCHESISDSAMIDKLKSCRHMNVSRQAAFCRSHRQAEARRLWAQRGYPDIQWAELPSRIEALHEYVLQVITNHRRSTFRSALEDRTLAGGDRSLLQTLAKDDASLNAFTPGYYGGRGARLITSQLMSAFSSEIRERAGQDKVIGAVGASGFVQTVLVPEVAVRLIMEDLDVTEKKAESVLEQSAELGYLLWEADDEESTSRTNES